MGSYVKLSSAVAGILVGRQSSDTILKEDHLWTISPKYGSIEEAVPDQKFFDELPIGSYVKLSYAVVAILNGGGDIRYNSEKDPPSDHSTKVWSI